MYVQYFEDFRLVAVSQFTETSKVFYSKFCKNKQIKEKPSLQIEKVIFKSFSLDKNIPLNVLRMRYGALYGAFLPEP
jgi:hypothetical protein